MRPVADPYDNPSESSGLADILEIATAIETKSSPLRVDRSRTTSAPVHLAPSAALEPAEPLVFATPKTSTSAAAGSRVAGLSSGARGAALAGIAVLLLAGATASLWPRGQAPGDTAAASVMASPAPEPEPQTLAAPPASTDVVVAAAEPALSAVDVPEEVMLIVDEDESETAEPPATAEEVRSPARGRANAQADERSRKGSVATSRHATPPRPATLAPVASRTAPAVAAPKVETKIEPEKKFSTDCILDPTLPGCSAQRANVAAVARPTADPSASLPDKLTQSQIRDGIEPLKGKAKACGDRLGAPAGTTIRIKLSIEGATGRTLSATATPPHAGDPLGTCVAQALQAASFPRFKSAAQGTTFPVKL